MACNTQTFRVARSVWSDGSTSPVFIGLFRTRVEKHRDMRVSVILEGSSGALTVSAAAAYGNTETDFATASAVDVPTTGFASRTADGAAWAIAYESVDAGKQLVDVGVKVKNTSGSKKEMGLVTLVIDFID